MTLNFVIFFCIKKVEKNIKAWGNTNFPSIVDALVNFYLFIYLFIVLKKIRMNTFRRAERRPFEDKTSSSPRSTIGDENVESQNFLTFVSTSVFCVHMNICI